MALVSVIVPARDAEATIVRTLSALAGQQLAGHELEVIVVDDGSRDRTHELVRRASLDVTLLSGTGSGPAEARNRGAAVARGAVLAFTDADCEPAPGWVAAGLEALDGADVVQGAVRPAPDAPVGPFDRTLWVVGDVLYETANLFVRHDLFKKLGGFESWLGPTRGGPTRGKELAEDTWLGWRARRAGARSSFASDAIVHHAVLGRGARGHVSERRRLEHFPALVARIPELRERLCYRRIFLSRRSAAFDLALAGIITRRPRTAALTAMPYAILVGKHAWPWGWRRGAEVALVAVAADAVGAIALLAGSLRARTLLL